MQRNTKDYIKSFNKSMNILLAFSTIGVFSGVVYLLLLLGLEGTGIFLAVVLTLIIFIFVHNAKYSLVKALYKIAEQTETNEK